MQATLAGEQFNVEAFEGEVSTQPTPTSLWASPMQARCACAAAHPCAAVKLCTCAAVRRNGSTVVRCRSTVVCCRSTIVWCRSIVVWCRSWLQKEATVRYRLSAHLRRLRTRKNSHADTDRRSARAGCCSAADSPGEAARPGGHGAAGSLPSDYHPASSYPTQSHPPVA